MAASVCAAYSRVDDGNDLGRDLIYFTYGLDGFADEIRTFMAHLQASPQLFEPCKFPLTLSCHSFFHVVRNVYVCRSKPLADTLTSFSNHYNREAVGLHHQLPDQIRTWRHCSLAVQQVSAGLCQCLVWIS